MAERTAWTRGVSLWTRGVSLWTGVVSLENPGDT